MIGTQLYWIDGPWLGKLAMAARPRGGDWLGEEFAAWRKQHVHIVASLLTKSEEQDLDLAGEADEAALSGLRFWSYPINDRQVPADEAGFREALGSLEKDLAAGRNVVLHCRQGVGRSGLAAACLLMTKGLDAKTAVARLSSVRGIAIPETEEQRRWIDRFATSLAPVR